MTVPTIWIRGREHADDGSDIVFIDGICRQTDRRRRVVGAGIHSDDKTVADTGTAVVGGRDGHGNGAGITAGWRTREGTGAGIKAEPAG